MSANGPDPILAGEINVMLDGLGDAERDEELLDHCLGLLRRLLREPRTPTNIATARRLTDFLLGEAGA